MVNFFRKYMEIQETQENTHLFSVEQPFHYCNELSVLALACLIALFTGPPLPGNLYHSQHCAFAKSALHLWFTL